MEFFSTLAKQFIFFSGDVQTTTIAMAITGSLCCSIMAAIVQVVTWANAQPIRKQKAQAEVLSLSPVSGEKSQRLRTADESNGLTRAQGELSAARRVGHPPTQPSNHSCLRCAGCGPDRKPGPGTCAQCLSGQWTTSGSGAPVPTSLRPLGVNTGVTNINLSFQRLDQWPRRLGFVGSRLQQLNLSHNQLVEIPAEIGCLSGLQHLTLNRNKLRSLPMTMASLRQLETLDIRSNQLTTIPECVLSLSSLTSLLLSDNRLEVISGDIENLVSLRRLAVDRNRVKALPDQLCKLKDLQVLECSHNPLGRVPGGVRQLVRLRELTLSSCRLTCLPDSLTRCAALHVLDASNNRLTAIPVQIGRLHGLRELCLHNNNITSFPASLLGLSLRRLTVQNNLFVDSQDSQEKFCTQPTEEFPPLLELTARYITQEDIPWETTALPDSLKAMLHDSRQCSRCEGLCFRYYASSLRQSPVAPSEQWLPLLDVECSPHSFCHFRP